MPALSTINRVFYTNRGRQPRCYRLSNISQVNADYQATKVVRFSHRSLCYCLILLIPVVIPLLIYIKDNDFTRHVFFGIFAAISITLLVCFFLINFHTRGARQNEDPNSIAEIATPEQQPEASASNTITDQMHVLGYCQCQVNPREPLSSPMTAVAPEASRLTNSEQSINCETVLEVSFRRENLSLPLTCKDNPPPYHVAVTLPSPNSLETPPPSYERASE